nr:hypothetical protein [Cycloclasticus sp. P1]
MPKCASTSIEAAIKDSCNISFSAPSKLKHLNAQQFSRIILPAFQTLLPTIKVESLCLIREPLEWIESWYRYRSRLALKDKSHPNHKNYTGDISYNTFIKAYISKGKRQPFANIKTQYDFIKLSNNDIGIDQIFPMDRLDLVADLLSVKTGKFISIPKKNTSKKRLLNLDSKVEKQLRLHLARDIAIYDFVKKTKPFIETFTQVSFQLLFKTQRPAIKPSLLSTYHLLYTKVKHLSPSDKGTN